MHLKYNYQSPFHGKDINTTLRVWVDYPYYNEQIIKEAFKKPVFIHFSGGSIERPWSNNKHHYYKLYAEYADMLKDYDKELIYKALDHFH